MREWYKLVQIGMDFAVILHTITSIKLAYITILFAKFSSGKGALSLAHLVAVLSIKKP